MGLRDLFAKVGLCESTKQVRERPILLEQLMERTKPYSRVMAAQNGELLSTYEGRLREVLSHASHNELSMALNEDIIPVMDQRLSQLEEGFWSSTIYTAAYNEGGKKMLCFYDNGDRKSGFWTPETGEYATTALNEFSDTKDSHVSFGSISLKFSHNLYVNGTFIPQFRTAFDWNDSKDYAYELKRNPELMQPPIPFQDDPLKKFSMAGPTTDIKGSAGTPSARRNPLTRNFF